MIGVVGGIGPYSGIDLVKKIFDNTIAKNDQEHLDLELLSMSSSIQDRTGYLLGEVKKNPGIAIANVILKLQDSGSTVVGIPCNTAHSKEIFNPMKLELKKASANIKVLNMIKETADYISANYPSITKVGVLSTTGTYKTGIYKKALQAKGYEVIVPSLNIQENLIHPAIYHQTYGIKTLSNPVDSQARENLIEGISFLKEQGAEAVILGCTEIPLAITEKKLNDILMIDPTNVLARALILNTNPQKLKPIIDYV